MAKDRFIDQLNRASNERLRFYKTALLVNGSDRTFKGLMENEKWVGVVEGVLKQRGSNHYIGTHDCFRDEFGVLAYIEGKHAMIKLV